MPLSLLTVDQLCFYLRLPSLLGLSHPLRPQRHALVILTSCIIKFSSLWIFWISMQISFYKTITKSFRPRWLNLTCLSKYNIRQNVSEAKNRREEIPEMGNVRQIWGFPDGSDGKESAMQETWVRPLRRECNPLQYCLENYMDSSMGSQRVGHD